jgi:site-specific DNA recombinase
MKKAIVLLRVSSDGQTRRAGSEEGYSLENQRQACYEEASRREAEVVRPFIASAESASKGAYRTLIEAIDFVQESGDIDYLIVHKLDRFARDELTQFTALAQLRAAGCQLVSVVENIDESPQGMLIAGILGSINAYESRNTARRVLDGLTTKARQGGTPKRAPLGYLNVRTWDGSNDIRTVEIDSERAPLIRWAFTVYATGEFTLNELVEELWERGLRTRPTGKRPPAKVCRSTLSRLLKDPYYVGVVRYRGVDYEGNHPTFIDRATFEQVQLVLENHHLAGEKHWRHANHLKGTVFCGYCGERLRFTQVRGRRGGLYRYFMCGTRHGGKTCQQVYLAEAAVEEAVARYYASTVRFDAERVATLETRLVDAFEQIIKYRRKQLSGDRRLIVRLETERRRLLDAHLAGAVPLDLFSAKQQEIAAKLMSAQRKVDAAERSNESAMSGLGLARKLLHKAGEAYYEADSIAQRSWNQTFFARLFVKPDETGEPQVSAAELTEPFAQLLSEDLATSLERMAKPQPAAFAAGGSNVEQIVETAGIEPASAIA